MIRTAITSTDCPLCKHPLINHHVDQDMRIGNCRVCSCPGTGDTGQARRFTRTVTPDDFMVTGDPCPVCHAVEMPYEGCDGTPEGSRADCPLRQPRPVDLRGRVLALYDDCTVEEPERMADAVVALFADRERELLRLARQRILEQLSDLDIGARDDSGVPLR